MPGFNTTRPGFKPDNPFVRGKAPTLEVDITDYGYRYAGVRPLDEASFHVRTYHFILPFHQIRPSRSEGGVPLVAGHMWVPIDDENTMVYNWEYSGTAPLTAGESFCFATTAAKSVRHRVVLVAAAVSACR